MPKKLNAKALSPGLTALTMRNDTKTIFLAVSSGTVVTVVSVVSGFVQYRLIFDYLPRDLAGVWFLFITIGTYVAFLDLGISPTVSREVSFAIGQPHASVHTRIIDVARLIATLRGILHWTALTVFGVSLLIGPILVWQIARTDYRIDVAIAWVFFAGAAAISLGNGGILALLNGLGDVVVERVLRLVGQLAGLALIAVLLYAGMGIIGLSLATLGTAMVLRGLGLLRFRQGFQEYWRNPQMPSRQTAHRLIGPSLKYAATGLGALLILYAGNIVLAITLGPTAIPTYEAVTKIAYTLMIFSLLITTSSLPFLSRSYASKDLDRMRYLMLRNVRMSVGAVGIAGASIAVFGDVIITAWLGQGNFVGFPVLWVLLGVVFLEVHHVALATATMAAGKMYFVWPAIGAGILNIALSLLLVEHYGVLGVALGTLLAQLVTNNWYAPYITLRTFNMGVRNYLTGTFFRLLAMAGLSLAVSMTIRMLLQATSGTAELLIAAVISMLIAGILSLPLITTTGERTHLYRWVRSVIERKNGSG